MTARIEDIELLCQKFKASLTVIASQLAIMQRAHQNQATKDICSALILCVEHCISPKTDLPKLLSSTDLTPKI